MNSEITIEFARQDDCLDKLVPSDLRVLVGERDQAREQAASMQEEIDRLKCTISDVATLYSSEEAKTKQLQAEVEALKAGQEWISVAKRMPEIGEYILAYAKNSPMSPVEYMVCQFTKYGFERSNISHWRQLPEPPKAGE